MNHLFITGIFRSGTTFLARALNSHPNLNVLSDPFFEFYKFLRNQYFLKIDPSFDPKQPLSDYFCSRIATSADITNFHNNLFELRIDETEVESLKESIIKSSALFSPQLINYINQLHSGSAIEVYEQLMIIAQKSYPKPKSQFLGTKQVWTDEFVEPLIKQGRKCIQIIRDPRAIIASNRKSSTGAYPILFLIRQWRKSVAYACHNEHNPDLLILKYEDLIQDSEISFRKICEFLQVPFSRYLIDPKKYKDGKGEPWKQNSSHGTSTKINNSFLDKWKSILSTEEASIIEWLCGPEMHLFGYKSFNSKMPMAIENFNEESNNIADWIKAYPYFLNKIEIEKEKERLRLLGIENPEVINEYFISQKTYKTLKESVTKLPNHKGSLFNQ
ncbi:MAG: sulfotransferase [Cyclobacteriaceae bacterium]